MTGLNFDAEWYLSNNADVRDSGIDPLKHYLNYGKLENRHPTMPKWFSESLSEKGWVRGEFPPEILDLKFPQKLSEIEIVRWPKPPECNTNFIKVLQICKERKFSNLYLFLFVSDKYNIFKSKIKKNVIMYITDEVNLYTFMTQILGSTESIFIIKSKRIKVIKLDLKRFYNEKE